MTLAAAITSDIANPTSLAWDATGRFLYVGNSGISTSGGWISVYDTANSNAELTDSKISTGTAGRPFSMAVDGIRNVYVAGISANSISVFQPQTSGGFKEASFSPISEDAAGNQFSASGAMQLVPSIARDILSVPSASGNATLYSTPLTSDSSPVLALPSTTCTSLLAGPVVSNPCSAIDAIGITGNLSGGAVTDAFQNVFVIDAATNSLSVYSSRGGSASPLITVH